MFSPTFIVWMTEQAPHKFAFELENGTLCCNVKGRKKSIVDGMRAAVSRAAKRIRDEITESAAVASPPSPPPQRGCRET